MLSAPAVMLGAPSISLQRMKHEVDDPKRLHKALSYGQNHYRYVDEPKKGSIFSKLIEMLFHFLFCFPIFLESVVCLLFFP